jgi:hypothetical protein
VKAHTDAVLYDCRFENCAAYNGGGLHGGSLWHSTLFGCLAQNWGGGVCQAELVNCLLAGNTAAYGGGACLSDLRSCTLASNTASVAGGGLYGGSLLNGICYYNNAATAPNYTGTVSYSCAAPLAEGEGNLDAAPGFMDLAGGDYRLLSNSACVNAGIEEDWMYNQSDLSGDDRIQKSAVDMGAYESPWWGMFADVDEDSFTDWIEVNVTGTDPTNAGSFLGMQQGFASGTQTGRVIRWQSVAGKLYNVDRATNIVEAPTFTNWMSGMIGLAVFTTITDTTATAEGPYFYRVGGGLE